MSRSTACPERVGANKDEGWLQREPTEDEQEVVAWLKKKRQHGRIFHVGVGRCLLSQEFGSAVAQGISRDGGEVEHAKRVGLEVILSNKYDVESYRPQLRAPFDLIVDVNVRSYSCCDDHFREFMSTMHDSLTDKGALITSMRGLAYRIPTTLAELRRLCPTWDVHAVGNVVVMRKRARWFHDVLGGLLRRHQRGTNAS